MKKHNWHTWLSWFFFGVGVVLLVMLVQKVGLKEVLGTIHNLEWRIIYVLIFPITWTAIQSYAWWRVLYDSDTTVKFRHVFLAKIVGEAINTVTPVSFLGGDPYRIYLLQKRATKTDSTFSVVIDRTMYMLAVVMMLFMTVIGAWFYLPLPGVWQILFPVITAFFFLAFVLVVFFQKKGMFGILSRFLQRVGIQRERLKNIEHKITEIDTLISGFYSKSHSHFFEIMTLQFLGRFLGVIEIYLIVQLLNLPVNFTECLFLTTLGILINLVFVFIPGSMGVMESGYGALFHLLNLNPAYGVAIQLIRRIRTFFWIGLGLLIMVVYKPNDLPAAKKEGQA